MELLCHCDHCLNNTCATKGVCWAELKLDQNNEIVKTENCFHENYKLVQNLICDHTSTKTSQSITKCCNSGNYCNHKDDFLPPNEEAKKLLLEYNNNNNNILNIDNQQNNNSFTFFNLHKSNIHMFVNLYLFIFLGVLIIVIIPICIYFRRLRKEGSENSSINGDGAINSSEMASADTNSLESREPLINVKTCYSPPINLMHNPNSLNHPEPNRGPYMAGETVNSNTLASFQMSVGSGDRLIRLRDSSTCSDVKQQSRPETSSGSGAGQPYLTQRSISHDIELVEVVGRGYFGVVWRGQYKGEPVAVKIFSSAAEASWRREAEIYQTTMLRHRNILGFIATDKKDDLFMTGYWLVTDYYPLGSLYDFLRERSMSMPDAVRMAFSIANGLAHLHVEIFGTQGKPAIAHRDVKSKNILVKNDGTCCLADLGMAARYNSNTGIVDVPASTRAGTRRYLAPEILDNKLNLMDFEAVKATDIYALGLVLWEVLRRTCYVHTPTTSTDGDFVKTATSEPSTSAVVQEEIAPHQSATEHPLSPDELSKSLINESEQSSYHFKGECSSATTSTNFNESIELSIDDPNNELALVCDTFAPPYQEYISIEPTMDELRDVVCVRKIRPPISFRWTKFAPMRDYATLMRECWYEKPQARLSALRVRKTLGDIAMHYFNLNMDYD